MGQTPLERTRCAPSGPQDLLVLSRIHTLECGYLGRDAVHVLLDTPISHAHVCGALRSQRPDHRVVAAKAVSLAGPPSTKSSSAACLWLGFAVFDDGAVWFFSIESAHRMRQSLSYRIQSALLWGHGAQDIDWPLQSYTAQPWSDRPRIGVIRVVAAPAERLEVSDYRPVCEFEEEWETLGGEEDRLVFSRAAPHFEIRIVRHREASQQQYAAALLVSKRDVPVPVASLLYSALHLVPLGAGR